MVFTLISQAVIGAFLALFFGPILGMETLSPEAYPATYTGLLFGLIAVETYALVLSAMHLGRPHRFYRAFYNLRYSPVSREVAGLAVFHKLLRAYTLVSALAVLGWLHVGLVAGTQIALGCIVERNGSSILHAPHLPHSGTPLLGPLAGADCFLRQHADAGHERLPGLHQHLHGHVIGDPVLVDQLLFPSLRRVSGAPRAGPGLKG